ncbi:MAG: hypothetical protein ACKO3T_03860 [Planctomycetaceae bacterium]
MNKCRDIRGRSSSAITFENRGGDRLLTAYFAGTIDESTLAAKQPQLRDESATVAATLATCGEVDAEDVRTALGVFQFAQNATQMWRGSKMYQKREILDAVCLNRMLGDVSLAVEKRKPFDKLAKRPSVTSSRASGI